MIKIDFDQARRAYSAGRMSVKDLAFLHNVNGKEVLTARQEKYLTSITKFTRPFKVLWPEDK